MEYDIKNLKLAYQGKAKIEWAGSKMKVLHLIRERFSREKPLEGIRICACLHVTSETANLVNTLKKAGAKLRLCASNPLSTQDDVAASLVEDYQIEVFAIRWENKHTYYNHIHKVLDINPLASA